MSISSFLVLFASILFQDTKLDYFFNAYVCVVITLWIFGFPSVRERFTWLFLRNELFSSPWVRIPIIHYILPHIRRWLGGFNPSTDITLPGMLSRISCIVYKRFCAFLISLLTLKQYTYTTLANLPGNREIRLIRLHPGAGDDPLRADIYPRSLDSDEVAGQYETISYAWEDSHITCRLKTSSGVLLITPSLFYALHRFRLNDRPRILWADAVCINQSDNVEKANQVGMMRTIYASAARTLVYLGRQADGSELVRDLLMKIATIDSSLDLLYGEHTMESLRRVDTALPLLRQIFEERGLPSQDDPAWNALAKVWGRQWFRRVWVIQEFVLSPDVRMFCGDWEVSWSVFYVATINGSLMIPSSVDLDIQNAFVNAAMSTGLEAMYIMCKYRQSALLRAINAPDHDGFQRLNMRTETMVFEEQERLNVTLQMDAGLRLQVGVPLLDLLTLSDRSEATKDRDHLFAVLGLASDANDDLFRADYSAPFDDIVRRYGKAFVRNGKCMDLLYQARLNIQSSRFPSWIPDWTTKFAYMGDAMEYRSLGNHGTRLYAAAGDTECIPRVSDDPNNDCLIVRGRFVDKLLWVGGDHVKYGPIYGLIYRLQQAYNAVRELEKVFESYATGEAFNNAWWRTLVANKTREYFPVPDNFGDGILSISHNVYDFCGLSLLMSPAKAKEILIDTIGLPYYQAMYSCYTAYQIAVTEAGLFGLVPHLAEAGDQICILNGGVVPFVLKRKKQTLGRHVLVGECYIHGLMTGEGIQGQYEEREVFLY